VIRERLNPRLTVSGIVLCMTDSRTNLSREVEASARKHFGPLVFRSTIRENVRVAESPSHCLPITRYAGGHPAAEDYRNLCRELLEQEKTVARIDPPAGEVPPAAEGSPRFLETA